MKNFFKFLGVISMVLVIGFGVAACNSGGNDDSGDDTGDKTGGGASFPAEFLFKDGSFYKSGGWGTRASGFITFQNGYSDAMGWNDARVTFSKAGQTYDSTRVYKLVSVTGKTIKVKSSTGTEITLCTGYTLEDNTLKLTGVPSKDSFSTAVQELYDAIFSEAGLVKMAANDF